MQLNEICELIIDCEHKTAPTQESGHPSIRTPNIGRGYFILENVNRVSQETYEQWTKRAIPQAGDLIMAREAPVGNVALIPEGLKPCLGQRTLLIRPDKNKVNPAYLTYLLIGPDVQGLIHSKTNGATVAHLNMKDVRQLELPKLPDRKNQDEIAEILSAYDSLIENNNRRIAILENMAQSLYREWFINFRFPGCENCKFVDSPLGRMPEGWEIKPLEELIDIHIGGGWGKEAEDKDHSVGAWVIRGTDIPQARNSQLDKVPFRYHTKSNVKSRLLECGDIVFEVSGGSKGQPVGRAALVTKELLSALNGEDVICASFCKRVKPKANIYPSELLYMSFLHAYNSGEIEEFQVQSTGITNFKWTEYVQRVFRVIPPENIRNMAGDIISSLLSQSGVLGLQIANLKDQRDMLLPRLVSGKIVI